MKENSKTPPIRFYQNSYMMTDFISDPLYFSLLMIFVGLPLCALLGEFLGKILADRYENKNFPPAERSGDQPRFISSVSRDQYSGSVPNAGLKEFADFFAQNKNAKVISYGFKSKDNEGWVTLLFEPYDDSAETITLYSHTSSETV